MAFSEQVVKEAWSRAGGQCECKRRTHSHFYVPCGKQLDFKMRGKPGQGGWEAHQVYVSGGDGIANCEIRCWNCHDTIL